MRPGIGRAFGRGEPVTSPMPEIIYVFGFIAFVADHPIDGGVGWQLPRLDDLEDDAAFLRNRSDFVLAGELDVRVPLADSAHEHVRQCYRNEGVRFGYTVSSDRSSKVGHREEVGEGP